MPVFTSFIRRMEAEKDDSEYMLRWNEHNSQLINNFHQLCQVVCWRLPDRVHIPVP